MGHYVAFLMGGDPEQQALHESLLARDSLEEMFEPRLPMTDPVAVDENSPQQHIGLTFFVIDRDGGRLIGHTGSQQAFRAFLYVDPIARTAVVAAFNTAAAGQDESRKPNAERVMATIRERVFRELFTRFRPPA
jgi:CubicO group peptidase (beta-lactamase class C family)